VIDPTDQAEVLREAAEAVVRDKRGGRVWRRCAAAWLNVRADALAPKPKVGKS
jgi:hypothetical protein